MFIDEVVITVISGKGGNGCMSFRREKYVPKGGPNGGSGGQGGGVLFRANRNQNTLLDYKYKKEFTAPDGTHGQGKDCHGKTGTNLILEVPVGTLVFEVEGDAESPIADLSQDGAEVMVLKGGKGGLGNAQLVTPKYQAPHFAELGEPGSTRVIKLSLKLLADVGLIGLPNAGKSTLISVISNARPKIADYPFTTLAPNLGVVRHRETDFVVADIPGLIEGAHQGKGLGHDFLKHVERTRLLVHLLDATKGDADVLSHDLHTINLELELFDVSLMAKPQIVVLNKIDAVSAEQLDQIRLSKILHKTVKRYSKAPLLELSSISHEGLPRLLDQIVTMLHDIPKEADRFEATPRIFRPLEDDDHYFQVDRLEGNVFQVRGKRVERIALTTDTRNDEALKWMHDRLVHIGVYKELEKQGIVEGDTVSIGNFEFTWE